MYFWLSHRPSSNKYKVTPTKSPCKGRLYTGIPWYFWHTVYRYKNFNTAQLYTYVFLHAEVSPLIDLWLSSRGEAAFGCVPVSWMVQTQLFATTPLMQELWRDFTLKTLYSHPCLQPNCTFPCITTVMCMEQFGTVPREHMQLAHQEPVPLEVTVRSTDLECSCMMPSLGSCCSPRLAARCNCSSTTKACSSNCVQE